MKPIQIKSLFRSLSLWKGCGRALFVFLLLCPPAAKAQTALTWEQTLDLLSATEDVESLGWASAGSLIGDLFVQKMDINSITREDLEQLPFLSAQQVEDICEYVYKYAPLKSLNELSMIESIDANERLLLCQFLRIDPPQTNTGSLPALKDIVNRGKNELMAYGKVPFYSREGDREGYEGYKYQHWLRYTFQYGDRVKVGLVASQDAGEPFFAGKNGSGYDYYTFYLQLKRIGRLKSAVLGRYRIRYGMGLVMNRSFSFGKLATLSSLGRPTTQITGHTSRMEGNYLQGAAATVNVLKGLDLSAFVSHRDIDATLTTDGAGIQTVLTTGYHRTESELNRKHNASQTATGGDLTWSGHGLTFGLTALYAQYSRPLMPNTSQQYREYYPEGKHFWNAGLHYGYLRGPLSIAGETATGDAHAIATLNTVSYELSSRLSLMALQRFYSYKFYTIFGQSFAEGSSVQNESGLYLGAEWKPLKGLKLSGYSDIVYFPHAKYLAAEASHAWDNLLQALYERGNWTLQARYRIRMYERDNADKTALKQRTDQRARLSATYQNAAWQLKTQADLSNSHFTDNSFGYMLSEQLAYRQPKWQAGGTVAYFHTHDYDSRVYLFEPGMIYTMNFPMFYGEGLHYALQAKWFATKRLMVQAKLLTTNYFDRSEIGSGLQKINHSNQTEMEFQLRWNF